MSARANGPATATQGGMRTVGRLAKKLLIGDFAPPEGPLSHRGLVRRVWPFALAGVVAAIMFAFPTTPVTDHATLYTAAGLTVALIAAVVFVPWYRLPEWAQAGVPFAFLGVIGLLRESTGGAAGFSVLVMLPVLWLALYGTPWQLVELARTDPSETAWTIVRRAYAVTTAAGGVLTAVPDACSGAASGNSQYNYEASADTVVMFFANTRQLFTYLLVP